MQSKDICKALQIGTSAVLYILTLLVLGIAVQALAGAGYGRLAALMALAAIWWLCAGAIWIQRKGSNDGW